MKVKELIAQLQTVSEELPVTFRYCNYVDDRERVRDIERMETIKDPRGNSRISLTTMY